LKYEWDEKKSATNLEKRGFGFELVQQFDWETALTGIDPRHNEPREWALGVVDRRVYFIGFTRRKGKIRIITFRKANKREFRKYDSG
jgi:uncharacterized protein